MRNEPKILVVEDDPQIRRLLIRRIERAGFNSVEEAIDGEDAFRQLDIIAPDLVLSDFQMPAMDGMELLKAIKASPAYAGIPFILMSGNMSKEARAKALDLGASACIEKLDMPDAKLLEVIVKALQPKNP